jgi:hypothetical protein
MFKTKACQMSLESCVCFFLNLSLLFNSSSVLLPLLVIIDGQIPPRPPYIKFSDKNRRWRFSCAKHTSRHEKTNTIQNLELNNLFIVYD